MAVGLGKREGIASRLFVLSSGKQLVAKINHVVCPGDGRASALFRIIGNLARPRQFSSFVCACGVS